jgi:hypothetical protein
MPDIVMYIILGVIGVAVLAFVIYKIVQIAKMKPEERKELIKTYLKGLIAEAEKQIGAGNGDLKFAQVEEWFNKKAPMVLKIVLSILGKENLKDLIEDALKEIKESFEK